MEYDTWKWGFWIRFNKGRTFWFAWEPGYQPLFSERMGVRKTYRFAGFMFRTEAKRKKLDIQDVRDKARRSL